MRRLLVGVLCGGAVVGCQKPAASPTTAARPSSPVTAAIPSPAGPPAGQPAEAELREWDDAAMAEVRAAWTDNHVAARRKYATTRWRFKASGCRVVNDREAVAFPWHYRLKMWDVDETAKLKGTGDQWLSGVIHKMQDYNGQVEFVDVIVSTPRP